MRVQLPNPLLEAGLNGNEMNHVSVLERTKRTFSPATLEARTIRVLTLRCNGNLTITSDYQVHDLTHDRWYSITSLTRVDSAVMHGDWNGELQRITR